MAAFEAIDTRGDATLEAFKQQDIDLTSEQISNHRDSTIVRINRLKNSNDAEGLQALQDQLGDDEALQTAWQKAMGAIAQADSDAQQAIVDRVHKLINDWHLERSVEFINDSQDKLVGSQKAQNSMQLPKPLSRSLPAFR